MKNCVSFPKDLQQRVQKISLKIHQAISRFFFPLLDASTKIQQPFFPRNSFPTHQWRGFSTLSQTIAYRPFPVNRVICSLIKRVINSTGSRQALLKTDSRPRSFRMFRALATIRAIATRFNSLPPFPMPLAFSIYLFRFFPSFPSPSFFLFHFFFPPCMYLSFSSSLGSDPLDSSFYTIVSGTGG